MSFIGGVVPCGVCGKRVYGAERADADGQTFHKACMRCAECNCIVKLGSYAALGGKFYCKPHFRQLFARSGNYHGAFEGQSDPKAKWLESMSAEVEAQGMGKDLRRVQSHVVQRPPAPRTTTALLREAEDQFTPAQQARKSLTPDEDTSYSKRRSFFERIASGPGTTAKRVFLRSHSKDEHQKKSSSEEAEVAPEAHKDKGKSKLRKHDKKESAEKEADQQAQAQAQAQANAQAQAKREEEAAAAAAAQQQKEEAERREREAQENRVREQEEREAREKVEEKRRAAIEEKRRAREQAEAESAAAAEQAAREQAARELEEQKTKKAEQEQLEEQKRQAEQAAAVAAAAEAAEQEKREKEQQQQQEQQLRAADEARAQREREEALAKAQREREEAERQRRQQQEAAAQARREKEEAERKARAEAAEARRREVEASKAKEASPSTSPSTSPSLGGDQAAGTPQSTSFSRVRNLTMRFAEQQKNGKGGKDLSIEGLKQQGHFKSIRDRWQFGDFAIPAYNKKGN